MKDLKPSLPINPSVSPPDPLPAPLLDTFADFDEDLAGKDRSPLTRRHYRADLERFAHGIEEAYAEPCSLSSVSARDIAAYKTHLLAEKRLKPQTVNRKLAALASFFRWALERRRVTEDPTAFIRGVKEARTAPKALERNEQNRLLRKAGQGRPNHQKRDLALVMVLLHTGLRVQELCSLKRSDVTLSERGGSLIVRLGKGRKHREVPLNADVRKALRDYLCVRDEVRPSEIEPNEARAAPLFLSQKGGALTPSAVWRIVTNVGKAAGVELSPHTLRHTFGTGLVRSGTDLVSVATLLGHESLNTTAVYTRPSRKHLAAEVQKLSALGEDDA